MFEGEQAEERKKEPTLCLKMGEGNRKERIMKEVIPFPLFGCTGKRSINCIGSTTLYYYMINLSLTFLRNYNWSNV